MLHPGSIDEVPQCHPEANLAQVGCAQIPVLRSKVRLSPNRKLSSFHGAIGTAKSAILLKSCGATDGRPQLFAFAFTIAQMTLGVKPCPQILPALLIDRSNGPEVMPAPTVQLSTASFTHCGTGIVRM